MTCGPVLFNGFNKPSETGRIDSVAYVLHIKPLDSVNGQVSKTVLMI